VLLLHGFPTSSQMFRNLIPALADCYRVVAPDYPGFGHSSMPARGEFAYTFGNLAGVVDEFTEMLGLSKYALYVQDYGAPVGYRLAFRHPDRATAIVVQNGNAYDEGLDNDFWRPLKAYWQEPNSQEKRNALRPFSTSMPPGGSTLTASRIPNSSRRTAGPWTSICWIARATTRSSSTCS
jgi:pimeloyl-ACP methyl ester carboxylesterase